MIFKNGITLTVIPYMYYKQLIPYFYAFSPQYIVLVTAILFLVYAVVGMIIQVIVYLLRRFTSIRDFTYFGIGTLATFIGCMCLIPYKIPGMSICVVVVCHRCSGSNGRCFPQ